MDYSETIFWINKGDQKDSFKMKIIKSTSKLEQLKSQVTKTISKKYEIRLLRVFNAKGFEIDDDDIYDIIEAPVLYIALNGENFSEENFINRYQLSSLVQANQTDFDNHHMYSIDLITNAKVFASKKKILAAFEKDPSIVGNFYEYSSQMNEISSKLNHYKHSSKLDVKDYFVHDSYIYFIYEDILTNNMTSYLRENIIITERKVKIIVKQIVDLLRFFNNRSIKHNNIHPNNIFFADSHCNKIKVSDFLIPGTVPCKKRNDVVYQCPEGIVGKFENNYKSDAWSVGVLMYLMLYGELPFYVKEKDTLNDIKAKKAKLLEIKFLESKVTQTCKELLTNLLNPIEENRISLNSEEMSNWLESEENCDNEKDVQKRKDLKKEIESRDYMELSDAMDDKFKEELLKKVKASVYVDYLKENDATFNLRENFVTGGVKDVDKYFESLEIEKMKKEQKILNVYLNQIKDTHRHNNLSKVAEAKRINYKERVDTFYDNKLAEGSKTSVNFLTSSVSANMSPMNSSQGNINSKYGRKFNATLRDNGRKSSIGSSGLNKSNGIEKISIQSPVVISQNNSPLVMKKFFDKQSSNFKPKEKIEKPMLVDTSSYARSVVINPQFVPQKNDSIALPENKNNEVAISNKSSKNNVILVDNQTIDSDTDENLITSQNEYILSQFDALDTDEKFDSVAKKNNTEGFQRRSIRLQSVEDKINFIELHKTNLKNKSNKNLEEIIPTHITSKGRSYKKTSNTPCFTTESNTDSEVISLTLKRSSNNNVESTNSILKTDKEIKLVEKRRNNSVDFAGRTDKKVNTVKTSFNSIFESVKPVKISDSYGSNEDNKVPQYKFLRMNRAYNSSTEKIKSIDLPKIKALKK